jgi:hypothetical protein
MLPPAGAFGLIQPAASACCFGIVTTASTITTPSIANTATVAIIAIDVVVVISLSPLYGRKQRPCEALNAGADRGKPFSQPGAASACCCSGIVNATVTTTTPSNAIAATMAISVIDVIVPSSRDK